MKSSRKLPLFLALPLIFGFLSFSLWADPVSVEIQVGTDSSFGFSWIHDASGSADSDGFKKSGDKLFGLSGTISGQLTGSEAAGYVFTLSNQSIFAAPQAASGKTGAWELFISNGQVQSAPGSSSLDPTMVWTFDYILRKQDGTDVLDTGSFYFYSHLFGVGGSDGPNRLFSDLLVVWGNNWDKDVSNQSPTGVDLGIDLKATLTATVPESPTYLLLLLPLMGMLTVAQRNRLRHVFSRRKFE